MNSSFATVNCIAALFCFGFKMRAQPIVCGRLGRFWNDTQIGWLAVLP